MKGDGLAWGYKEYLEREGKENHSSWIYIYTITAGLWDAGFNENESLLLYCMGN